MKAAELINSLHIGISIKRFPSGVCMLRLDSMNEDNMCQRLAELCQSNSLDVLSDGLLPSTVAKSFNMSIILAKEILIIAENRGILCRDDSIGGLAFFYNYFDINFNNNWIKKKS